MDLSPRKSGRGYKKTFLFSWHILWIKELITEAVGALLFVAVCPSSDHTFDGSMVTLASYYKLNISLDE